MHYVQIETQASLSLVECRIGSHRGSKIGVGYHKTIMWPDEGRQLHVIQVSDWT